MQPVQDLTVEDRVSRTQFQYSMEDADARELARLSSQLVDKLRTLPELRDVASDQQTGGLQADVDHRSRYRVAAGHSARSKSTTHFTTRSGSARSRPSLRS